MCVFVRRSLSDLCVRVCVCGGGCSLYPHGLTSFAAFSMAELISAHLLFLLWQLLLARTQPSAPQAVRGARRSQGTREEAVTLVGDI